MLQELGNSIYCGVVDGLGNDLEKGLLGIVTSEWILHLKIVLDIIIIKHMHIFLKSQAFKHKYFPSIESSIFVILIWTWNLKALRVVL